MEIDNMSTASEFSIIPDGMVEDNYDFEHVSHNTTESNSLVISAISTKREEMNVIKFGNVEGVQEEGNPIIQIRYCIPNTFQYKSSDRICLYKVGFSSFQDYVAFKWAPPMQAQQYEEENLSLFNVVTTLFDVVMPPDEFEFYQFCYVTSEGQIIGVSSPFQLNQIKQSSKEYMNTLEDKLQSAKMESKLSIEKMKVQEERIMVVEEEKQKIEKLHNFLKIANQENLLETKEFKVQMENEMEKKENKITELVSELLSKEREVKSNGEIKSKQQKELAEALDEIRKFKQVGKEWEQEKLVNSERLNVVLKDNGELRGNYARTKQQLEELKKELFVSEVEKEAAEKVATDLSQNLQKAEVDYQVVNFVKQEMEAKIADLRVMLAKQEKETGSSESLAASTNGDWICVDETATISESGHTENVNEVDTENEDIQDSSANDTPDQEKNFASSNIPDEMKIESKDNARAENFPDSRSSSDNSHTNETLPMVQSFANTSVSCNSNCSISMQQLTEVNRHMEEIVEKFTSQIDSLKTELNQLKQVSGDKSNRMSECSNKSNSSINNTVEDLPIDTEVNSDNTVKQDAESAKKEESVEGAAAAAANSADINDKSHPKEAKIPDLNHLLYGMSFLPAGQTAPVFLPTERKAEPSDSTNKPNSEPKSEGSNSSNSSQSSKGPIPASWNQMFHAVSGAVAASVSSTILGKLPYAVSGESVARSILGNPPSTSGACFTRIVLSSEGGPPIPMPPPPTTSSSSSAMPPPSSAMPPPFSAMPPPPFSMPTPSLPPIPSYFQIPPTPPIILRPPTSIPMPTPSAPTFHAQSRPRPSTTQSSTNLPSPMAPEQTPAAKLAEEQKKTDNTFTPPLSLVKIDVDVRTNARHNAGASGGTTRGQRSSSSSRCSSGSEQKKNYPDLPKREASVPPNFTTTPPERDPTEPLHCPMCSMTFPSSSIGILEEHVNLHLDFVCPVCSKAYQRNNQDRFQTHVESHFPEDSTTAWEAPEGSHHLDID